VDSESKKKVCLVGDFAVGKTSLTRRFVNNVFSDKYLTTVGVKIDTKVVSCVDADGAPATTKLVVWDIAGESTVTSINESYMRGLAGYLLVADGTRSATLDTALHLHEKTTELFGSLPFVVLLNKRDLTDEWDISESDQQALSNRGFKVYETSAKSGNHVEEAFVWLAGQLS